MAMTPNQLKTFLTIAIKARCSVLIKGAPGIGKTDVVGQATDDAGADLILSHPAVEDPTDPKGLAWAEQGATEAKFLPFGPLARACKATRPTVWFVDDLGQAPPSVQAAYMQLFLARRVNDHVLPDCVTFIAATNRRTDKAGVSGILEPVKSRFVTIVELETTIDDWSKWAYSANVPAELIAFLRFRPNLLSAFNASADLTNSPTPRTWNHVGKLFSLNLPKEIRHEVFSGAVGEGAATEFESFLQLYAQLPNIDAILVDPETAKIPESPAALYAVTSALAMRANQQTFGRIARYAERLLESNKGEFAALLLRDSINRDGECTRTTAFAKLMCQELGQLISGGMR